VFSEVKLSNTGYLDPAISPLKFLGSNAVRLSPMRTVM